MPARFGSVAEGHGRLDAWSSQLQDGERNGHDLTRHAVGKSELFKLEVFTQTHVSAYLTPRLVLPQARGLSEVPQDGHAAIPHPPPNHAKLHRGEVLSLIDDNVFVALRPSVEKILDFVGQRDIA